MTDNPAHANAEPGRAEPAGSNPARPESPVLSLRGVDIAFGGKKNPSPTVFDVDLDIYPGETVAIVGESGSGKSTLAHSIIGLLPGGGHVTGGTITFDGEDITHAGNRRMTALRGAEIGLVPQDPMSNLNPVWKVGHQIKESLRANGIASGSKAHARAIELLEEAGLPDAERRIDQYPHEYSGGMRQRALIAIGLSARPKLLIADEPTSALDVTVQRQILDHLDGLTRELGTSVLLITHDLGLAAERASRIIVMSQGHVVEWGPALEILQDPRHEYTKRLVSSAPSLRARRDDVLDRRAEVRDEAREHAAEPSTEPAGATAVTAAGSGDGASGDVPILEVRNLTKVFDVPGAKPWKKDKFTAVDDVSFAMPRGTTTAIVGESGSGKSTVAQMVLGLLEPTSGSASFDGVDVVDRCRKRGGEGGELDFRRRVQPIFQNPYGSLDPMYSVYNTIAEPLRIHGIGDEKSRQVRVNELLDRVSIPRPMAHRYPAELSGGQRQRVAIARALALDPELVVCDEAVSALDVLVQSQILDLLNSLQAELGLSYLFITHDLAVVKQIADQVLVMEKGRIVETGRTDELFENPTQDYTRRLIDSIPGGSIELHAG
ncbi:ABC transporter ATP-binding protein [uncultured Corynebacterium sp.]|uniref:dipeptide ABC transporter ATP-binding protein n=1 Tax=uncultured Corynebacterium sp. TaxID=159447 RepID=UPI0025E89392|nr:ABC transporter ATP-binding protein [uncultured Corynebacterium sp.]